LRILISNNATCDNFFSQAHVKAVSPKLLTWSGRDSPVLISEIATSDKLFSQAQIKGVLFFEGILLKYPGNESLVFINSNATSD